MRKPKNLLPLSIALLALAIATTGTAAAATGQLVNIADGSNAGQLAKVDASGALRVLAVPAPPARPYSTDFAVLGGGSNGYRGVSAPTTATVAVNRLVWSNDPYWARPSIAYLYSVTVPAGSPCSLDSAYSDVKLIGKYAVASGATVVDALPSPLVLRPNGTRPWCLLAAHYPTPNDRVVFVEGTVSGYVISGTAPPGTTAPAADEPERLEVPNRG